MGLYVLFSYPEKIRGLSRKTREEIDLKKKILKKFWFEIINICWNPKNHVFGPKMAIIDLRTLNFRISVTNYVQKTCFWNFRKIPQNGHFWILGPFSTFSWKRLPRDLRWPSFALTYTNFFLCSFLICQKLKKGHLWRFFENFKNMSFVHNWSPKCEN